MTSIWILEASGIISLQRSQQILIVTLPTMIAHGDGTVTHWSLTWSSAATQVDSPPKAIVTLHTIVIERTTDCVLWTPIFTNAVCPDNCPQFFTDTNAPADRGFYRVLTQ